MKAVCWFGKRDIRVEQVDDPKILNPRDAIVRVTSTAICGSDLHYYFEGRNGDFVIREPLIPGHEFSGEVEAVGPRVTKVKPGDRVEFLYFMGGGAGRGKVIGGRW